MEGPLAAAHLFSEIGLPIDIASEAQRMVPLDTLIRLYEDAARLTGDPLFGLKAGQEMVDDYGLWVEYARRAPTLRACLERASRSIAYHQTGTSLTLSVSGGRARYAYRVSARRPANRLQHLQHTIPALLETFRVFAGEDWKPDWIELDLDYDPRIRAMEKALSVPVRCGQPAMALVFSPALLDRAQKTDAPASKNLGWTELKTMVRDRPPRAFADLVRETIHLDLISGAPQIDGAAQRLGMGPRTVQRRLQDEGCAYRDLVAEVRAERGKMLLASTDLPITEIAFRLGYSDPTHLARAFSQRVGTSPTAYRKARRGTKASSS